MFIVNKERFSPTIAAKIAGVSAATLANWRNREILAPERAPGAGRQLRLYSFRDLVAIRVLLALKEGGISPSGLRRVVAYLRKRKGLSASEALASTVLITDGFDVFEVDGSASVSTLLRPGQAVFHGVVLHTLVHELQRDTDAALSASAA